MSLTPRGVVSLGTATATQIMDAYQVGLQAMRVTKAELGLDADTVAEIVDEVGAEIDEAKAVSDSLAQGACLWQWWWWWWWCDGSTATLTCGLGSTQTCRYSKPARTSFWTNWSASWLKTPQVVVAAPPLPRPQRHTQLPLLQFQLQLQLVLLLLLPRCLLLPRQ